MRLCVLFRRLRHHRGKHRDQNVLHTDWDFGCDHTRGVSSRSTHRWRLLWRLIQKSQSLINFFPVLSSVKPPPPLPSLVSQFHVKNEGFTRQQKLICLILLFDHNWLSFNAIFSLKIHGLQKKIKRKEKEPHHLCILT